MTVQGDSQHPPLADCFNPLRIDFEGKLDLSCCCKIATFTSTLFRYVGRLNLERLDIDRQDIAMNRYIDIAGFAPRNLCLDHRLVIFHP